MVTKTFTNYTNQVIRLKRNQIANFLEVTLVILAISIAGAGYFTYQKLNEVVSQLETETKPNNNLLLYKEIILTLNAMENQAEAYQLTDKDEHLNRYHEIGNIISLYLDSLNKTNFSDRDLLVFNDSLSSLIERKTDILNELLTLKPENPTSNLTTLKERLNDIPDIVKDEDPETQIKPKKGFLKRLFDNQKDEAVTQDSIIRARADQYKSELHEQIERIKLNSEYTTQLKRQKEIELEASHFDIQNQIMDLISFLEAREALKLKMNTVKAQELTAKINEQIILFTSLATILLITSVFVMFSYVRKNRKYQLLLQESKRSVENLARAKERFFANMSHEIRTPMNAISGFTKILLKSELGPVQKEQVEIIHKSSDHLLKLLNDILDFSKLQAEKLQLESTSFDLEEVCMDSLKLMQESADKKNLRLSHEFINLPKAVKGDPYRLRQILLNLLNNSIKFTEKGEVKLTVSAKSSRDKTNVHIEVVDTGMGIPKDQQHKLFKEFEQADQSSFSKGSGLGLAITKRLVMLHEGGKINLKSEEGAGTKITIKLKYLISEEEPEEKTVTTFTEKLGTLKVLIADDEPFNVKLLATLLRKHNIDFDEAYDGEEAYHYLIKNTYDIILLDLKMPKMNGWEIVESIKNNPGPNKDKPFIALTATINKLEVQKGQKVGFDHIMRKPFDENELFEFIAKKANFKTVLHKRNTSITVDLTSLYKMGDHNFVDEMVETFVTSSRMGIETIKADLAAKNYKEIALVAHRIVAPARHFKALELVSLLKALQTEAEKKQPEISIHTIHQIEKMLEQVIQALRVALEKETAKGQL